MNSKRLTALILSTAFLCALQANAREIATAADFVAAMTNAPAGSHVLTADIDLAGADYTTIPNFTGTLDGAGHSLFGLGAQSLCVTNAGTICSLTIDGTASGGNTTWKATGVGVFCQISFGGKFTDCVVRAYTLNHLTAGAQSCNGLFCATAYDGTVFIRCMTDATCQMNQNAKANNHQGGLVGAINSVAESGVIALFTGCTNNAAIISTGNYNDSWASGGLVGFIKTNSELVPEVHFIRCVNNGAVTQTGSKGNIGGLVGLQQGASLKTSTGRLLFAFCVNNGAVSTSASTPSLGGILGRGTAAGTARFRGCVNFGDIIDSKGDAKVGGLVGLYGDYMAGIAGADELTMINCANYGNITGKIAGGLAGGNDTNTGWNTGKYNYLNCASYGVVTGSASQGGIVGTCTTGASAGLSLDNCWAAAAPFYASASRIISESNLHTPNDSGYTDADALQALNAQRESEPEYLPWTLGSSGHPELGVFSERIPGADIAVVFCDWDGSVLDAQFIASGASATAPSAPSRDCYTFAGWNTPLSPIFEPTVIFADYTPLAFSVTFDTAGGFAIPSITNAYGTNLTLPVPERPGYEFVCWSEDQTLRILPSIPDYDITLKAFWKKIGEPIAKTVKVFQWSVKSTDTRNRNTVVQTLANAVEAEKPDFILLIGLDTSVAATLATYMPENYAFHVGGSNGSSDGGARVLGWNSEKYEKGPYVSSMATSNSTGGYLSLFEPGTDNYFVLVDIFYNSTKKIGEFTTATKSVFATQHQKHPTATFIVGTDFTDFTKASDYASSYNSDWTQTCAAVESNFNLTALRSGDDFLWTLFGSAYAPLRMVGPVITTITDDTVSTKTGYFTEFRYGGETSTKVYIH